MPRERPEPLNPCDEKRDKFCRYHQRVYHPTRQCREVMETIPSLLDKEEIVYKKTNVVPKPTIMMVSRASGQDIPATEDGYHSKEVDRIEDSSDVSVAGLNQCSTTLTLVVAAEADEHLPTPPKEEIICVVSKHKRKVLARVSTFDASCMSPASRNFEHALAKVTTKHGGA